MIAIPTIKGLESPEFHGHHISKYSTSRLFKYGFINPRGSVFTWGTVIRTVLLLGLATVFAILGCPTDETNLGYKYCFPVLSISEGFIFASLVSFLLGLFMSQTFSRWWSIREKLGAIMNNISYASMLLSNFSNNNEGSKDYARKISRLMNAAHHMIYKQATGDLDLNNLVNRNLLTNEEREALDQMSGSYSNLVSVIYNWTITTLRDMHVENHFANASIFSNVLSNINACFFATQDVFMFLETQMPYSYLHLLTIITKIHMVFVVFFSAGVVNQGITSESWSGIILGYAILFFNNVIYEGLLFIHNMLVNPLGNESGDFPKDVFSSQTEKLCDIMHYGVQGGASSVQVAAQSR